MILNLSKQKYAFVLGNNPKLSAKEIEKVLQTEKADFKVELINDQVMVVHVQSQLKPSELQNVLGGTIKIALIADYLPKNSLETVVTKLIKQRVNDLKVTKKFQFGFSRYGNFDFKRLERLGLTIKKELKKFGVNSRLVISRESTLSSVIVQKENMISQGADIILIDQGERIYLGYTLSVQGFEAYSQRDYGRPARDDRSGMLPPKVAQMMINLSQAKKTQTLLDPFCGSGTVLQEALFLGFNKLIGTDLSAKAIQDCQNNLNWLKVKYQLDLSGVKLQKIDVTELSNNLDLESIDCIITEPYLGPVTPVALNQNYAVVEELNKLYLKAFIEFQKVLKKNGKVVIILPVINKQKLEILLEIKKIGFQIDPLSDDNRGSLVYSREGQRVMREIFIFIKK